MFHVLSAFIELEDKIKGAQEATWADVEKTRQEETVRVATLLKGGTWGWGEKIKQLTLAELPLEWPSCPVGGSTYTARLSQVKADVELCGFRAFSPRLSTLNVSF